MQQLDLRAHYRRELEGAYLDVTGGFDGYVVVFGGHKVSPHLKGWRAGQLAFLHANAAMNRLAQIAEGARHG